MSSILSQIKQVMDLNEKELELGLVNTTSSWHDDFSKSAYIHFSGFPYELNEGDVLQVFSQYGEPVHLDLQRDPRSGKSLGFGFLAYEDQRSTVLAVDNMNGAELMGRKIKVNHTKRYYKKLKRDEDDREKKEEKDPEIPMLLRQLYGESYFKKMKKQKELEKDPKRLAKKKEKERRKMEKKMKKRERKKKRKEEKKRLRQLRKKQRQATSQEDVEAKRNRMRENKEMDYEKRKLVREAKESDQKVASYGMAYKYGSQMNLGESQFDLTDLKVYQYEKYQNESEKYKRDKEDEEMRVKDQKYRQYQSRLREQDSGKKRKREHQDDYGSRRGAKKRRT